MRERTGTPATNFEKRRTARKKNRSNDVKSEGELHGAHGAMAVIVPAEAPNVPSAPTDLHVTPASALATPLATPTSTTASLRPARPRPAPRIARLDPAEQAYRAAVLRDIAARERTEGPHTARPHADRARQFMPFAALKGYREMTRKQETVREPRHDMTEERALALSKDVAGLRKGDIVRIVHYGAGAYHTVVGAVTKVDEAFRSITIVKRRVAFDDILSIERLQ